MTTAVQLRPLAEADLPLLHRWYQQPELWGHLVGAFTPREEREALSYMRRWLQPSDAELRLGIVSDGRLVGQAFFSPLHREAGWGELHLMIGEPDQRGRGVGRAAVGLLMQRGWSLGLKRIELRVLETNLGARRIYELCGFREASREPPVTKAGVPVPVIVMSCDQPPSATT